MERKIYIGNSTFANVGESEPSLRRVLELQGTLHPDALYLGHAYDGLPVCLDLADSVPGPILITGDRQSGKTSLLKTIARATEHIHKADHVNYCIVTTDMTGWSEFSRTSTKHNVGVYDAEQEQTTPLVTQLADFVRTVKNPSSFFLLFLDNLQAITEAQQANIQVLQDLRYLLLRGPAHGVWPIATIDAPYAHSMDTWSLPFRTRLFTHMEDSSLARTLTGIPDALLNDLTPGQYVVREGETLVPCWYPTAE